MKIVLSRKGFDHKHGGMPSPILPDGTLLLMPTPSDTGTLTFHDLYYNKKSYFEIIRELKPKLAAKLRYSKCHMDPDLSRSIYETPSDWKPAFGQAGTAESHLNAQRISVGDIFLFFGWFKQTEYTPEGKLRFVPDAPDLHIIYGYLQIGEIIKNYSSIAKKYHWHPHAANDFIHKVNNTLYIPTKKLSLNNMQKGYGLLKYNPKLVLTKEGHPQYQWNLPSFFNQKDVTITYHNNVTNGFIPGNDYFLAASIGEEFVIHGTFDMTNWAHDLIKDKDYALKETKRRKGYLNEMIHLNYPDQDGNIYCRKNNKIIKMDSTTCNICKGLRGDYNTNCIECGWKDYNPDGSCSTCPVKDPSEEFKRVNWLIKKQLLPNKSDLE